MNDDDLFGPKLTPPPSTAPIVRGAAVALVTVALATSLGCTSNPGLPATYDTGITFDAAPGVDTGPVDGGPGVDTGRRVIDAGITIPPDMGPEDSGLNPGVPPAPDSGADAP
jgi:hypothetical protein